MEGLLNKFKQKFTEQSEEMVITISFQFLEINYDQPGYLSIGFSINKDSN